ncbi:MDR family MFS transporter [Oikeobacillus pervagus]|nr:MDR family MFS transporter [Oikeobacillus pervagus]
MELDKSMTSEKRKTKRPLVLAAVMLAMFMGAIEATIVSTAMPSIVADLGGFSLYSWVFSAYLLMNTVTVLIYGKLSDIFGRKLIITIGISLFLIGSILCGFADTMVQLIVYRFIQGLGAGAVMPVATTIVGDIYTKEERAKIQGYLSSVWGISAIFGPAIGGLLVQYVSWRYVFWMNIPLGVLSILGIWFFLHEEIDKKKPVIDYKGSFLFALSIFALMFLLIEGGVGIKWISVTSFTLILFASICFWLFIRHERNIKEPLMPFDIWRIRSIFIANSVSFTTGVMLIGISSFLPTFVQAVMGQNATVAGFTLTAMSIGWPIASTISGRLIISIGYRKTSMIGGILLMIGGILFIMMKPSYGPIWAGISSFFFGAGMGLTSTAFIVSIQETVEWQQRGIATAANMFMRNFGNTVGAALLGGILNSRLQSYLNEKGASVDTSLSISSVNELLSSEGKSHLSLEVQQILQEGLTVSLNTVYFVVFLFAIISFVFLLFMPKKEG